MTMKKIVYNIKLDPPKYSDVQSVPQKYCNKGLVTLAKIALNYDKTKHIKNSDESISPKDSLKKQTKIILKDNQTKAEFLNTAPQEKLVEVIKFGGSITKVRTKKNKTALLDSLTQRSQFQNHSLVDFEKSSDRILFTDRL
jgi:hypothetical protein